MPTIQGDFVENVAEILQAVVMSKEAKTAKENDHAAQERERLFRGKCCIQAVLDRDRLFICEKNAVFSEPRVSTSRIGKLSLDDFRVPSGLIFCRDDGIR